MINFIILCTAFIIIYFAIGFSILLYAIKKDTNGGYVANFAIFFIFLWPYLLVRKIFNK